ncbi:Phytochrome E [Abeliophyllum distichum]|uniref:Phytochrome E n=1 Tax=Abeliophyllum distichum TaxID=126358 RepID=A0ABD1NZZ7_9LAMI
MNTEKATAQFSSDARVMAEFENSGESGTYFNYSKSVNFAPESTSTEEQMTAYLSCIQRGGLVQSFGCMLAIEEPSFAIIAYSENCFDMLGLSNLVVDSKELMSLIGIDARTLFTPSSSSSLEKAAVSREISLLNPIWVHSRATHNPFYAILHKIDVGIVIDLEPAHSEDPALLHSGAVQSQKLAVRAISRLQSLPGRDIGVLCDTVVEEVQKLTGYDRVMVYRFHDDNHGEVVSEIRRSDLEPYLGLHYPAIDIPQAARFLFKQNRVRMIYDCHSRPVKIIQSEELKQPLCLVNSTLRAPHGCHMQYMVNMQSIASLVMAVLVNNSDSMKLWGLVACHHTSARCVAFPLRCACEFLMQAFGLQLYMELQLASLEAEKKILRTQTLLCDLLLRDIPLGIVTRSPSIINLVKCDGAALYYGGKCWLLGVTPTEVQVKDIVEWLLDAHGDSTGFSTDSLFYSGYPSAHLLGDAVCGMAMAQIRCSGLLSPSSYDFLFWFRSHTAKEIRWGGEKHCQEDKDDGSKMHPRSSFKAFLEVVKSRSLPWEVSEINAIHSLQLIIRHSFQEFEDSGVKPVRHSQPNDYDRPKLDELSSVAAEMVRLIETANAPIFGVNSSGFINGWNAKMNELTGLQATYAMGKSLVNDIVHEDSRGVVESVLHRATEGEEDKNVELKILRFGMHVPNSVIYLLVNACTNRDCKDDVVGVCFVGQDVTHEKLVMDKFTRLQADYEAIIQSLNPLIPPVFASDENAYCSEWNAAMEKLTGWMRHEILGKMLPGEIFGNFCQLKCQDTLTKFTILLHRAISGHDVENLPFGFFDRKGVFVKVLLTANKRTDEGGNKIGCLCFLQTLGINRNKQEEEGTVSKLEELAYIRQEIKNPLNGIRFIHQLLEGSAISDNQKQFLETSEACERQILSIINDVHFASLEEGRLELNMEEFILGDLIDAIVCQIMIPLKDKNLQLVHDISDENKSLCLYGDRIKLQLVVANFFLSIVHYAPSPDGWVEIKVCPGLKLIQDGNEFVHLQFRMAHPGQGLPPAIVEDMLGSNNQWKTQEGVALNLSQKLLHTMSGNVRYIREQSTSFFQVDIKLQTQKSG